MTSARAWGIKAELLTLAEVVAKAPFVNGDAILGGFYTPSVSVVDSVRAGAIMRERARARGVLTVLDNTEVTGLAVARPPFGRSSNTPAKSWACCSPAPRYSTRSTACCR